jgi:hypothetical protein
MFEDYKVVVVCPAGRRVQADLMRRYVERERPLVDELHWWLNTDNLHDIAYFRGLEDAAPDFYRTVAMGHCRFNRRHMSIGRFFRAAIDPQTIYVRIDDDVVWMAEGCLGALVRHRVAHPDAYLVYGNIVNSSRFMHLHQKAGAFDPGFEISYDLSHPTNRRSVPAALAAHRAFLDTAEALARGGDRTALLRPWVCFDRHVFAAGVHNDCNMISWFGRDFAAWRGVCPAAVHEEQWICLRMPAQHGGRIHEACGAALCAHYASVDQWSGVDAHSEILGRYARLAPPSEIDAAPRAGHHPAAVSLEHDDAVS